MPTPLEIARQQTGIAAPPTPAKTPLQIAREQVGIPAPAPKKTPLQLAREQTGIPAPAKPDGIGEVAKAAAKAAKNPAAKSWLGTMLSGVADVVQHPVENVAKPFAAGAVSTGKALIDTNVRMGKQLTGSSALPGPLGAENQLAELSKTASAASEYVGGPKLPATPRPLYNTVRWGQEHVGEPIHKWASDKLKDWQESHPEWSAGQVESLGDVLNPSKLTRSMAASAPYMIASGAAMAAGHPEVAFAIVFGAEGQPAYEEAVKAGASEEQANATANVVGLVNGAIEMAKVGQIVKFIGGGDKVLAKTATQIAKNALKKAPQSVTKEFIKTVASNALEEASQQVTSELTPNVIYGKPIEPGFWERQLTSGVVGGIQAGLFAGAPRLGMAGLSKVAGKPPEAATPPQTPAVPPKAPTPPQTAAAPSLAPDATLAAGVAPAKPTVPTGAVVTTPPPPTVHEEVKDVAMKGYMAAAEAVANAKIALDDATVAETAKAAQDTLTAARAKLDAAAKFVTAADKVAQSAQTAQTAQAEPAATENVPRGTIPAETPAPTVKEPLSVAPAPAKRVTELTPPETAAPVAAPKPAAVPAAPAAAPVAPASQQVGQMQPWEMTKADAGRQVTLDHKYPEELQRAYSLGQQANAARDAIPGGYGKDFDGAWYDGAIPGLPSSRNLPLNNPPWYAFFKAGEEGRSMPPFVSGWRYGDLPLSGVSTNFSEGVAEKGVSVMHIDMPGFPGYGGTYDLFNGDQGRIRHVVGYLVGKGSDGEPILVGTAINKTPHSTLVSQAIARGDPVPAAVLRDYAGEPWADAALAKLEPANTPGQPLAPAADAAVAPEPGTQAQAAKAKRARFERGDTDSAIASARRLKSDKPVYITPTTYGLAVGREAPPAWQQHLVVHPDGRVETVSASTDVRPPSEVIPQAEKDGRRKILQARIKRGENVGGVKMLNEFRGETWADEAIAAIKKPTWKTDELAQRAHSLSDEITDDAQAPLYYQKPTQGQPFTLFRGAAQGEPGTVLFYSHDPGIASTYALNRAGAETTENGLKWPQGSKTAEVVEVSVTPKRILDLTGTKAVPEKAMAIIRKHAPEWASQLAKKDEASARVPKEASRNKALWSELGAGYDLAILSDFTHGGVDYSFVPLGLTGMAVKRNAITYVSEKSETPNWKRVVPEPVVNQKDVVDDTAVAAKQAARAAEAKKQRDLMERAHRVMIEGHNQSLEEGDVETDSGESEAKPSKKTRAKKPLLTQEEKAKVKELKKKFKQDLLNPQSNLGGAGELIQGGAHIMGIYARALARKGAVSIETLMRRMVSQLGQAITPHLNAIYAEYHKGLTAEEQAKMVTPDEAKAHLDLPETQAALENAGVDERDLEQYHVDMAQAVGKGKSVVKALHEANKAVRGTERVRTKRNQLKQDLADAYQGGVDDTVRDWSRHDDRMVKEQDKAEAALQQAEENVVKARIKARGQVMDVQLAERLRGEERAYKAAMKEVDRTRKAREKLWAVQDKQEATDTMRKSALGFVKESLKGKTYAEVRESLKDAVAKIKTVGNYRNVLDRLATAFLRVEHVQTVTAVAMTVKNARKEERSMISPTLRKQVKAILDAFIYTGASRASTPAEIVKRAEKRARAEAAIAAIEADPLRFTPTRDLKAFRDALKVPLNSLSVDELLTLKSGLDSLLYQDQLLRNANTKGIAEDGLKNINESVGIVELSKADSNDKNPNLLTLISEGVKGGLFRSWLNVRSLLRIAVSKDSVLERVLINDVVRGQIKANETLMHLDSDTIKALADSGLTADEVRKWSRSTSLRPKTVTINTPKATQNGKPVNSITITYAQAMALYDILMSQHGADSVIRGAGLNFEEAIVGANLGVTRERMLITPETRTAILKAIPAEVKAYSDALHAQTTWLFDVFDAAHYAITGKHLIRDPRYSPIPRNIRAQDARVGPVDWKKRLGFWMDLLTFAQDRKGGIKESVLVKDGITQWAKHVQDVSHYVGEAGPLQKAWMLIEGPESGHLRNAIDNRYPGLRDAIKQALEAEAGEVYGESTWFGRLISKVNSTVARSLTLFNVSMFGNQYLGLVPLTGSGSIGAIPKAYLNPAKIDMARRIATYAVLYQRYKGLNAAANILTPQGEHAGPLSAKTWYGQMTRWGTNLTVLSSDRKVIQAAVSVALAEADSKGLTDWTPEHTEFMNYRLSELIEAGQGGSSPLLQARAVRAVKTAGGSFGALGRTTQTFTNVPYQLANAEIQAVADFYNAKGKQSITQMMKTPEGRAAAQALVRKTLAYVVLPTLTYVAWQRLQRLAVGYLASLLTGRPPKDDDRSWGEELFGGFLGLMPPVGLLYEVGRTIYGREINTRGPGLVIDLFAKTIDAFRQVATATDEFLKDETDGKWRDEKWFNDFMRAVPGVLRVAGRLTGNSDYIIRQIHPLMDAILETPNQTSTEYWQIRDKIAVWEKATTEKPKDAKTRYPEPDAEHYTTIKAMRRGSKEAANLAAMDFYRVQHDKAKVKATPDKPYRESATQKAAQADLRDALERAQPMDLSEAKYKEFAKTLTPEEKKMVDARQKAWVGLQDDLAPLWPKPLVPPPRQAKPPPAPVKRGVAYSPTK